MGVDYEGVFGLGYRIKHDDVDERQNICEVLDEKLNTTLYSVFEVGDVLNERHVETFVVLRCPFKYGLSTLNTDSTLLLTHLTEIGVQVDGDFDIQGGLRIS